MKLSTQLSTSKEDHRSSDLFSGAEPSKTFISTSEHQLQMSAMEDRISKLENLVWALYKELNGKIDSSAASTQIQIEELTGQMAQANQARRSEDGYQGSEEENTNIHNGISPERQNEDEYYQSSLCKVEEEASSQDYSQEGGDEFSRNTIDRSDPNVVGAKENPPHDYQSELMNIKEVSREDSYQNQNSYDSNPDFYGDHQILSKQSDTPENSDGEGEGENGDLEYYFSCHERIVHDTCSGIS